MVFIKSNKYPFNSGVGFLFKMHVIFVLLQQIFFAIFESENIFGYNSVQIFCRLYQNVVLGKKFSLYRSSHGRFTLKKVFSKNSGISQESNCVGVSFRPATLSKEAPRQVFSYEICDIFENTYFEEHLRWLFLYVNCRPSLHLFPELVSLQKMEFES